MRDINLFLKSKYLAMEQSGLFSSPNSFESGYSGCIETIEYQKIND